ncbi:MAG: ATP-binding protein [Dehalococcoidia bacterium]|nr:MAG: ATP-binding protein [Dehalococcoidia bacterium]
MISKSEIIELIEAAEETPTLDYKEDLHLETDADKAEFVKDVIALANSGELAHIIVGVEDKTGKCIGLKTTHDAEQLNQILKDRCDPSISVEYAEKNILGHKIGVIEFQGDRPPYIVSVPDKFGGPLSSDSKKRFFIHRGTIFVRNYNINEGARRADVDKIYDKIKYVSLQADLQLNHKVSVKPLNDLTEVNIEFALENQGDVLASNVYVWIQFENVEEIVRCTGSWRDISKANNDIPTASLLLVRPVVRPIRVFCSGLVVKVKKDVNQVDARVIMSATNMRTRDGAYVISLEEIEEG